MTECDKSARKNRYDAMSNELENIKKIKTSGKILKITETAVGKF